MKQKTEQDPAIEAIISRVSIKELSSWKRMMKKMVSLIDEIRPIEDAILLLTTQKMPIFDRIQELRMIMVSTCIHPKEHLVVQEGHVLCKFCDKRLRVQHAKNKK